MIKIILLDIDGLIIRKKRMFSRRLEKEFGISARVIQPFFKGVFLKCETGKTDLKKELKKIIPVWGWKRSVGKLLDYWFNAEAETERTMLNFVDRLRASGFKIFLQTNQERYRAAFLWHEVGLKKHFHGIFSSCDLGYLKPSQLFWKEIHKKLLPIQKSEVMVWDDGILNVASAKKFGYKTYLYQNFASFRKRILALQKHQK
ncbi:MAG: HAD family hydrolase [bacterium]|nr:HAD family hydrolase [bacterium]